MSTCNIDSYKCSDEGLLMPIVNEYTWAVEARAVIYFLGLVWSFLGVSIIADIFMQSIEMITSRTNVVRIADPDSETGYKEVEVKTWNNTVANLTLMALGSSAPEILLSIIEIVGNSFEAGELGPGTIVGSAAFNLFCITGVCVFCIPDGEKRRIRAIKVFAITAVSSVFAYVWLLIILVAITPDYVDLWEAIVTLLFFPILVHFGHSVVFAITAVSSVFAYIWLLIILVAITPDYVDLWEAIVTLLFFPLLVLLAYIADREFCCAKTKVEDSQKEFGLGEAGKVELIEGKAKTDQVVDVLKRLGNRADLTEEDEARITTALVAKKTPHSRAWYRINAVRNMTGGHKLVPSVSDKQAEIIHLLEEGETIGSTISLDLLTDGGRKAVVEWAAAATAVLERDGRAKLALMRHGNLSTRVLVHVETIDGTATSGSDYIPLKETIVFEPDQTLRNIDVEIIDDNDWEPDEIFMVKISIDPEQTAAVIGKRSICNVTIVNDDSPGSFEFSKPCFVFKESAGNALVEIRRFDGCDGKASVKWETRDQQGKGAAVAGRDYHGGSGELVFQHGELTKMIEIGIIDDQDYEKDEHFDVVLTDCSPGSSLGNMKRTVVTILNDDEFKGVVSRIVNLTNANLDQISVSKSSWGKQFYEAMNVNGGDIDKATTLDYVMHFLTFGFKIIFALVPPPQIWGGWLAFFVSLSMIGVLTAVVGDLASIFGCLIGLKPAVTAITFVAIGTSLPDLFASKQAAVNEEYADNSIGNVTGSNSVNVFLGLGLPWTIAAIYWSLKDKTFEVPAGTLSFSVILYAVFAVATIVVLLLRRFISVLGNGELGGPKVPKTICAVILVMFWVLYVLFSSLNSYEYIKTDF